MDMLIALGMISSPIVGPLPGYSTNWATAPVSEAALGSVVGMAASTTRLSALVGEQGASQGQRVGEDQRAGLAVWFADGNVQAIANLARRP